jgi:hypothetical protein
VVLALGFLDVANGTRAGDLIGYQGETLNPAPNSFKTTREIGLETATIRYHHQNITS